MGVVVGSAVGSVVSSIRLLAVVVRVDVGGVFGVEVGVGGMGMGRGRGKGAEVAAVVVEAEFAVTGAAGAEDSVAHSPPFLTGLGAILGRWRKI